MILLIIIWAVSLAGCDLTEVEGEISSFASENENFGWKNFEHLNKGKSSILDLKNEVEGGSGKEKLLSQSEKYHFSC